MKGINWQTLTFKKRVKTYCTKRKSSMNYTPYTSTWMSLFKCDFKETLYLLC